MGRGYFLARSCPPSVSFSLHGRHGHATTILPAVAAGAPAVRPVQPPPIEPDRSSGGAGRRTPRPNPGDSPEPRSHPGRLAISHNLGQAAEEGDEHGHQKESPIR